MQDIEISATPFTILNSHVVESQEDPVLDAAERALSFTQALTSPDTLAVLESSQSPDAVPPVP